MGKRSTVPTPPATDLSTEDAIVWPQSTDSGSRYHVSWSDARLSAAVAASRPDHCLVAADQPLRDEIEFMTAVGTRHEVPSGVALVQRGTRMDHVHLICQGAAAVIGDQKGRRPILSFAVPGEFCCAIPALLQEPAPWDAVTVMSSSVTTVPAAHFTAAVGERWVERWSTRALSWLAEIGERIADLDKASLAGQVAALLLRHRGVLSLDVCNRTFADLLDVDDEQVRRTLTDLEQLDAVRLSGNHVSVARPDILRTTSCVASGAAMQQGGQLSDPEVSRKPRRSGQII